MKRFSRILILGLVGVLLIGAGAALWHFREREITYFTDADSIRREADAVAPRDILWRPPDALSQTVNGPADDEFSPGATTDGTTLFFVRPNGTNGADLYMTTKSPFGWTEPAPLDALNTDADELGPCPSPDGARLYFFSNRDGGEGLYDIWVAERSGNAWAAPVNLGPQVNSRFDDYGPAITPDQTTLYFTSNRPDPDVVIDDNIAIETYASDYDLYASHLGVDGPEPAAPLASINTDADEGASSVSPAGDFLYFASGRDGGLGGFDLYRARIRDGELLAPRTLGDEVNTPANELDPSITSNGFGLYFASDRPLEDGAAARPFDLYHTTAREVFSDTEHYRASLDWGALWDEIWPYLLAIIGLLLLLLLLFLILKLTDRPGRRLSLIAKCILISALLHVLLVLLLTVWGVTNQLANFIKDGDGQRVVLVSSAATGDLMSQVRGGFTEADIPVPEPLMAAQQPLAFEEPTVATELTSIEVNRTEIETSAQPQESPRAEEAEAQPADMPTMSVEAPQPQAQPRDVEVPEAAAPARQAEAQMQDSAEATEMSASAPAPDAAVVPSADVSTPTISAPAADTASAPLPSESLHESTVTEAQPQTEPMQAPQLTATTTETPSVIDVQVAAVPQQPTERAMEAEHTIQAEASDVIRQDTTSLNAPVAPAEVAVELSPDTTGTLAAASQTLHEPAAAQAAPASSSLRESDLPPALVDISASVPIGTPAMPEEHNTPDAEAEHIVDAPARTGSSPAQLEPSDAAAMSGAQSAAAELAPSSVAPPAATSTVTAVAASDAAVATPTDAPASSVEMVIDMPEAFAVALPAINATEADEVTEQTAPAIDVASATPRNRPAPDSSLPALDVAMPAAVAIEPDIRIPGLPETTERDRPDIAESAASPTLVAAAPSSSDHMDIPKMDMQAMDLPTLEEDAPSTEAAEQFVDLLPRHSEASRPSPMALTRDVPEVSTEPREIEIIEPTLAAADAEVMDQMRPADIEVLPLMAMVTIPQFEIDPENTPEVDLDVPLPRQIHVPPNPYSQRAPSERTELVEKLGGSKETERAVERSLAWLAAHQEPDGRWNSDGFHDDDGASWGRAKVDVDIATTGLALLCFLGADHTHLAEGPYRDNVERGVRWLVGQQKQRGDIMGRETLYSHGIASIAVVEAFGMSGDPELREPAQKAVTFIHHARNTQVGGWRYGPGQVGDTSVLGWQVMALVSAQRAGLNVPRESIEGARRWLEIVSFRPRPGLYAYQPGQRVTPAMTAEGLFVQQLLGRPRLHPHAGDAASYVIEHPPDWEEDCNTYFWYYATLSLFQHGGQPWEQWNERIKDELLSRQIRTGPATGSWDPDGRWADVGGRIYQTAICTLTLEVYYRYLPSFVTEGE